MALSLPLQASANGNLTITQKSFTNFSHKGVLGASVDFDGAFGDAVYSIGDGIVEHIVHNIPDYKNANGDLIGPTANGDLTAVHPDAQAALGGSGLGNYITIKYFLDQAQTQPYYVTYAHLSEASVDAFNQQAIQSNGTGQAKGYQVGAGDEIAKLGSTGYLVSANGDGSHLHIQFGTTLHANGYADATENIDNVLLIDQLDFGAGVDVGVTFDEGINTTADHGVDFVKDKDYFQYDLTQGQTYQFTVDASVVQNDTLDAVFVNLYDENGNVKASNQDAEVIRFEYTPQRGESGNYYLAVSAGDTPNKPWSSKTGDFTVNVQPLGQPTSEPIEPVNHPIGRSNDRDITFPGKSSGEFRNNSAFAAIRENGSVVTWGSSRTGGDSSEVASELNGDVEVVEIYSSGAAFAALRSDGSVVTWGTDEVGGDSSAVASELNGDVEVVEIYSSGAAFAALRSDGSVVTWGNNSYGSDSSAVASELNGDVVDIYSTAWAFAALRSDGSVAAWGDGNGGGNSRAVASELNGDVDVVKIYSSLGAFAALRSDGSVVTWGNNSYGSDSSGLASELNSDVVEIYSSSGAFAALLSDGSVVTWGGVGMIAMAALAVQWLLN